MVASGTGTTAYFLAQYFASRASSISAISGEGVHKSSHSPVEVLAVPCVSTAAHLQAQMQQLRALCGSDTCQGVYPTILSTEYAPCRVFAKPAPELLGIWQVLRRQSGIDFDLIYAPRTFEILLSHCPRPSPDGGCSLQDWLPGKNVLYYHCGGTEGNESQLQRYEKAGLLGAHTQ